MSSDPIRTAGLAVLIDADNVSAANAASIFQIVRRFGEPIVRRAYGMVSCFASAEGWPRAQREFGIASRPQVSNVSRKNVADIALVIDAMELLYRGSCAGICIVSNDSDFTALAVKIRESGKLVYGIGGEKTPASFRMACTKFFSLPAMKRPTAESPTRTPVCPRCGAKLAASRTKSLLHCRTCSSCGGMSVRLTDMRKFFAQDCIDSILQTAAAHQQAGCVCPICGSPMSLVRVQTDEKTVEIDVCAKCKSVWYDKDEFETLVPNDGAVEPTVSAGKAYRRELVTLLSADLRASRIKATNVGALKTILKKEYHVPGPDVQPVIGTLACLKVIKIDKTGKVTLITP